MIEYVEWGIIYVDSDDISSSTKTVCTLLKGTSLISMIDIHLFFDSTYWPVSEAWLPQRELIERTPGVYFWSGKIVLYKEYTEHDLPLKELHGTWKRLNPDKLTPELFL